MRQVGLADRVAALGRAVEAADGRADPEVIAQARAVVERAGERVAFDGEYTVVALAGATGSGKSSLFNAITGTDLAQTAVRRPTTSRAMAVAWGSSLPHELLDWLDVPRRHLVAAPPDDPLAKLVLVDLPDHDSAEVSHRLTVDRLVERVDGLLWVVDPQKYADAALHHRYLEQLAAYSELMIVLLNQADRLTPDGLNACLRDLRRLLDSEGLRRTPVMATSAVRNTGVAELRVMLARTVATKQATVRRLATDVAVAAARLGDELGSARPGPVPRAAREQLTAALGQAAGVPTVVAGVEAAWRKRGKAATGWPFTSWIGRLRPDPLKRLRLEGTVDRAELARTALPKATPVQQARVEGGLRALVDAAAAGLPRPWAVAVAEAAHANKAQLPQRLDTAISATDLRTGRGAWWWGVFRLLQWVLVAAVLVGGLASLYRLFGAGLGLPPLPEADWYGVPVATWLLLGGILAGILLALLGRVFVGLGARARARAAEKSLRGSIAAVTAEQVVEPVQAELDRYAAAVEAVAQARG